MVIGYKPGTGDVTSRSRPGEVTGLSRRVFAVYLPSVQSPAKLAKVYGTPFNGYRQNSIRKLRKYSLDFADTESSNSMDSYSLQNPCIFIVLVSSHQLEISIISVLKRVLH